MRPSFTGLFSVCEPVKAIVLLKFPLISRPLYAIVREKTKFYRQTTGRPSSKYEHRRASALLRNIQNIRICMGKKPIVSLTYENERISTKNSLPYLKCVLRLSCVVHGPIYGRFMGFYLNGFRPLFREKTVYIKPIKRP